MPLLHLGYILPFHLIGPLKKYILDHNFFNGPPPPKKKKFFWTPFKKMWDRQKQRNKNGIGAINRISQQIHCLQYVFFTLLYTCLLTYNEY